MPRTVSVPGPSSRWAIGMNQLVLKTLSAPRGPVCCCEATNALPCSINIHAPLCVMSMSCGIESGFMVVPGGSVIDDSVDEGGGVHAAHRAICIPGIEEPICMPGIEPMLEEDDWRSGSCGLLRLCGSRCCVRAGGHRRAARANFRVGACGFRGVIRHRGESLSPGKQESR